MAKAENSKQRILALGEILLQETDEEHRLTAAELEEMLRQREIPGERKSIYRDLAMLADQGMDIIRSRRGYYLGSRTFQLAELKLLADAVQCSRCITEKKSYELIGKLGTLTSRHNAGQLHRQPGGKGDVAVAELLGSLAEALHLLGGEDAVLGDNPAGEFLGPAVEQKAQALDPFDILFQKCHCTSFFLVLSQLFLIILLVIPWVK